MAVIDTPDDVTLIAPGPNPTKSGNTQVVGQPGARTYYYWVIVNYPIGSSVSGPFPVRNAPNLLNTTNYVATSWEPAPKAIKYDLLRTDTTDFPAQAGNYAVVTGIGSTFWRDQGAALQFYDLAGLRFGAPVRCRIYLNNRDYTRPTLEFPCQIKVSNIVFPDGSEQDTAGGGGGEGPPGPPGPQGPVGPQGATGAQGPAGQTGAVGPEGAAGAAGATGPQGPAGATGAQGPTGLQGPTGPQGPAGTGVTIKGSVPTEADLPMTGNQPGDGWITEDSGHLWVWGGSSWTDAGNIIGPPGPQGPQGPIGATGPQGATGATGSAGPQGATGPPGPIIPASATVLGGVKIGININVQPDGTISVPASSFFQTPWLSDIDAARFSLNNLGTTTWVSSNGTYSGFMDFNISGNAILDFTNAVTFNIYTPYLGLVSSSNILASSSASSGEAFRVETYYVTKALEVMSNGNIGIGLIADPTYKLDVAGDVNVTGVYRVNGVPLNFSLTPWTSDIDASGFRLNRTGGIGIGPNTWAQLGTDIWISSSTSNSVSILINNNNTAGTGGMSCRNDLGNDLIVGVLGSQSILFSSQKPNVAVIGTWSTIPIIFSTASSAAQSIERMRITPTGNVGIGTSNPLVGLVAPGLHVYGTAANAGNIMVETTDGAFINVKNGPSGSFKGLMGRRNDGTNDFCVGHFGMTGGNLGFYTDNGGSLAERMRINSAGSVGIGTATPLGQLDVIDFSRDPSSSAAGTGGFRLALGPVQGAESLLFGVLGGSGSWIQAMQAGVTARHLYLNPLTSANGNVILGCPEGTYANLRPNSMTFFLVEAANQLHIRLTYSDGSQHDVILSIP